MVLKDVDGMSTKTKKPRIGLALVGLVAVGAALAFAAQRLTPLLREYYMEKPADTEPESLASQLQSTPVSKPEITATPEPTEAPFAGWDTEELDAFCARQASGFSVYAQDLETGMVYTLSLIHI